MAGSPFEDWGGTPCTAKTGLAELVWLASATAAPLPWVYWRWTFTQDGDGTLPDEICRTPTSTGVSAPLAV